MSEKSVRPHFCDKRYINIDTRRQKYNKISSIVLLDCINAVKNRLLLVLERRSAVELIVLLAGIKCYWEGIL